MTFDLYVWSAPRDLDADQAEALLESWHEEGGDPSESPFEPSSDVGWFHRELTKDAPELEAASDAVPTTSTRPVWLSTEPEPPARSWPFACRRTRRATSSTRSPGLPRSTTSCCSTRGAGASTARWRRWPPTPQPRSGRPARSRRPWLAASAARRGRGVACRDPHHQRRRRARRRVHVRDGRLHVHPRGPEGRADSPGAKRARTRRVTAQRGVPGRLTLSEADRRVLAAWAADCAERTLHVFESHAPDDRRPREAIAGARAFAAGELRIGPARSLAAASHAAARAVGDFAAVDAARAAGHAAATAHMAAHARGASSYAAMAISKATPGRPEAVEDEVRWQRQHTSDVIREVLRRLPPPPRSAGVLGTLQRELHRGRQRRRLTG